LKSKYLFSVFVVGFIFAGCNSISTIQSSQSQNKSPQKETQIKHSKAKKVEDTMAMYPLRVIVGENKRIRIMNIKPKYHDGILLKKGAYRIEVSDKKDGTVFYDKWVRHKGATTLDLRARLKKSQSSNISVSSSMKNVQGKIQWAKDSSRFPLYETKKYFWDAKKTQKMNWYDAYRYCKNRVLNTNGIILKDFSMPSMDQAKDYMEAQYKNRIKVNKPVWTYTTNAATNTSAPRDYAVVVYSSSTQTPIKSAKHPYPLCKHKKIDFRSLSLESIANNLLKDHVKEITQEKFTKKPEPLSYKKLTKGEFETTKAYKERVAKSRASIDEANQKMMQRWEAKVKEQKENLQTNKNYIKNNKDKLYLKFLAQAMHVKYGTPKIEQVTYNADKEVFEIILGSQRAGYKEKAQVPVKMKYAKKFKELLTQKDFIPTVELEVKNGNIKVIAIQEIKDPEYLVEEDAFNTADSMIDYYLEKKIIAYKNFIQTYPNSSLKEKAQKNINILQKKLDAQIKEEKERKRLAKIKREQEERERKEREQRKSNSYFEQKSVGEKVCKDGTTAFILSITISGYVERVNGDRIQIRIANTEGTNPYYNGVTLYKGTLIWDKHTTWYKCNY